MQGFLRVTMRPFMHTVSNSLSAGASKKFLPHLGQVVRLCLSSQIE
jgi:hypothetical protein